MSRRGLSHKFSFTAGPGGGGDMIVKHFEPVRDQTLLSIYLFISRIFVCFSKSDNSCCSVMCCVRDCVNSCYSVICSVRDLSLLLL
jgi:hypothetical protein